MRGLTRYPGFPSLHSTRGTGWNTFIAIQRKECKIFTSALLPSSGKIPGPVKQKNLPLASAFCRESHIFFYLKEHFDNFFTRLQLLPTGVVLYMLENSFTAEGTKFLTIALTVV
jgi:hypothetical protein